MLQLVAEGPEQLQRWKASLEPGNSYELGRDPATDLPVPWDLQISRRHISLRALANRVDIAKRADAVNGVYFDGQAVEHCTVATGQHFVLGSTKFYLLEADPSQPATDDQPVEEVAFDREELQKVRFRDADKRIDVLANLPQVIDGSRTDSELYLRLVNLLLAGVANAEAVAIVEIDDQGNPKVLNWDRRRETAGAFRPSSRLVTGALGKRRKTILHTWEPARRSGRDYTEVAEFDWAFCTPVQDTKRRWGMYVTGRLETSPGKEGRPRADAVRLQADVKFTELIAEIISSVRRTNELERLHSGLRQFFAPPVLAALGDSLDTNLLEPRECQVTVLFCDLRGFSQRAEESANDLLGLLERVSLALELMTQQILKHGGVTGDFQGDAALAFWGWPIASDRAPLDACRAALGIRAAFAETQGIPDHPLANFQMGIGVAHGNAVAGKIGTSEQVKVTVFGPVVNLASRLESLTKQLRVPIVIDEATAEIVRKKFAAQEGRVRKLARILPAGLETPVAVSELLPPVSQYPELSNDHVRIYEEGVEHFVAGRWEAAYRCFHSMPAGDRAQDFPGVLIAQHNRVAPAGWDGVVRLQAK